MKRRRALWLRPCSGLMLMLGLAIAPVLTTAADPPRIVGTWEGVLNPGGQLKKRVVVNISAEQDGSLSGTIDYPDQDVSGILITAITYKAHQLHFESTPNLCVYDGTLNKDGSEITGNWKQSGAPVSLIFKRTS